MRPRIWGAGRLHYHAECEAQRRSRHWMTCLRRSWRLDGGRAGGGRGVRARAGGDGRSRRSRRGADRMFLFLFSVFLFLSFGGEGERNWGAPLGLLDSVVAFFLIVILYFISRYMRPEVPWPWQRWSRCPKPTSGGYLTMSCPCPMDYLAIIVGQPLPLFPFSAGKDMANGKDNGKKHSLRPAPSPSLLRRGLELLFHLHLAPFQSPGLPKACHPVLGRCCAPHSAQW